MSGSPESIYCIVDLNTVIVTFACLMKMGLARFSRRCFLGDAWS